MATGKNVPIGHGMKSCTKTFQGFQLECANRRVVLVDTPGIDGPGSEPQRLDELARWLEKTYKAGTTVVGILYLHRISDNRSQIGNLIRYNSEFKRLCGQAWMQKIILVTTMWDNPKVDQTTKLERQQDLESGDWKTMIQFGSVIVNHYNTADSAQDVVETLLSRM